LQHAAEGSSIGDSDLIIFRLYIICRLLCSVPTYKMCNIRLISFHRPMTPTFKLCYHRRLYIIFNIILFARILCFCADVVNKKLSSIQGDSPTMLTHIFFANNGFIQILQFLSKHIKTRFPII